MRVLTLMPSALFSLDGSPGPLVMLPASQSFPCSRVSGDESSIGQRQATECSDWWTKAGREILRVIPPSSNDDLNDIVRKWVGA